VAAIASSTAPSGLTAGRGGAAAYAGAAKRAFSEFRRHEMTDVAASLTYYAMMSLFPSIVLATSLFSLIGDEQTVTVTVRDFGIGLRAGEAERVFDRFWRADPSRTRRTGGRKEKRREESEIEISDKNAIRRVHSISSSSISSSSSAVAS